VRTEQYLRLVLIICLQLISVGNLVRGVRAVCILQYGDSSKKSQIKLGRHLHYLTGKLS